MISPDAPVTQPSPMSILVLLPESISAAGQRFSAAALQAQGSRSPGTSPSLRSGLGRLSNLEDDLDHHNAHSRRLSLGPGIGGGLRSGLTMSSSRSSAENDPPSPSSSAPATVRPSMSSLPTSPEARPADLKPTARAGSISGRSSHSASPDHLTLSSAALKIPRGSVALPSGPGLLSASGGRRPAIVGDELVDALRQGGLEVTAVRQAAHLSGILTSGSSSSTVTHLTTSRTPAQLSQNVVLCPIGESPTLPSLSLLHARGTTPSAVCFQQDLLDRARKVEDDWLATATTTIQHVEQLCSAIPESPGATNGSSPAQPIIIAYVTSGTPSPTAIETCIGAGAYGVLHPPFGVQTAAIIKHIVTTGRQSTASSTSGLSSPRSLAFSPLSSVLEDDPKVILTPTALGLGAEHESEKVLSAFGHQRRRRSTQLHLSRVVSPDSAEGAEDETLQEREPLKTGTSTSSVGHTVATPSTTLSHFPSLSHLYDPFSGLQQPPNFDPSRRRSVDTGGIALAFDRATKLVVSVDPVDNKIEHETEHNEHRPAINVVAGEKEQEAADGTNTTQFAEVLGEMYQQTMSSIDIQMEEYEQLAAPISREDRERLVGAISTWDFRPHLLPPGDLYRVACLLFEAVLHTEGVAELGLGRDQVNRFLFAVRAIYHAPNPYHNYVHAIDVLQATYSFLNAIGVVPGFEFLLNLEHGKSLWKRPSEEERPAAGNGTRRARGFLRPQDVLGVMIAAMGHDVGHPGLSNAFLKNAKVPLSVVYDDKSVLENMHCMLIVHLLRKHGFGFLLGPATQAEAKQYPARASIDTRGFRRVLYSAILATDMALHFAWIQRLKDFAEAMQGDAAVDREALCEEDRVMLCQALIKCADISNPTRPIDVSEHWSTVLLDEWTKQASLEEELELPVSVVAGVDARLQAKGQIGFIDLFTNPLFKTTADVVPEMRQYAESCDRNRSIWQARLEQFEEDAEMNETRTAALRSLVRIPVEPAQDERFHTLFPLILPPGLVSPTYAPETPTAVSPPQSPMYARVPASPAVQAVRVVYRDEVHDRSMLSRHVLALTGFDPAMGTRRMSTPEVLLVHSRSS